jgi:hypothetical protein
VADEFISFDKVLRELQMQEEELKRLVSEGEIRAFRDQDKMKFKKEDVDRFRKSHTGAKDETMGAAEVPEELVFDEDDANQDVGMATAAISDDSFLEEQPQAAPEAAPEPAPTPARAPSRGSARSPSASASGRKPRASSVQIEEGQNEGIGFKLAILLSAIVLVIGTFVAMDATKGTPSGLTRGIADWFKSKN